MNKHYILYPVIAVIFMGIGGALTDTASSTETPVVNVQPEVESPEATAVKAVVKSPVISDGTYEVPSDIKPGKYKTAGGDGGCYYSRLSSTNTSDILSNDFSEGPMVVLVKKTDAAVNFNGGCTWTKVAR